MAKVIRQYFNEDYKTGFQSLEGGSVDLIVTDPPYLHVKGGMKSKRFNVGDIYAPDSKMVTEMPDFGKEEIFEFLGNALEVLKKANMYVFCSKLQLLHYFEFISEYNENTPKSRNLKYDLLIWDKDDTKMKSSKFHTSDIEYIIRIYEPGVSLYKVLQEGSDRADSAYYQKLQTFSKPNEYHTTEKPLELIKRLISVSSKEGDLVVDPFMGSGTTGEACYELNRKFIGYEIDEKMHEVALNRLKQRYE